MHFHNEESFENILTRLKREADIVQDALDKKREKIKLLDLSQLIKL
jgi:Zn-finger protein